MKIFCKMYYFLRSLSYKFILVDDRTHFVPWIFIFLLNKFVFKLNLKNLLEDAPGERMGFPERARQKLETGLNWLEPTGPPAVSLFFVLPVSWPLCQLWKGRGDCQSKHEICWRLMQSTSAMTSAAIGIAILPHFVFSRGGNRPGFPMRTFSVGTVHYTKHRNDQRTGRHYQVVLLDSSMKGHRESLLRSRACLLRTKSGMSHSFNLHLYWLRLVSWLVGRYLESNQPQTITWGLKQTSFCFLYTFHTSHQTTNSLFKKSVLTQIYI